MNNWFFLAVSLTPKVDVHAHLIRGCLITQYVHAPPKAFLDSADIAAVLLSDIQCTLVRVIKRRAISHHPPDSHTSYMSHMTTGYYTWYITRNPEMARYFYTIYKSILNA